MDPVRQLLHGIVDYAGLFPPTAAPMDEAVAEFARQRRSGKEWMLAAFVVPVSRLAEFIDQGFIRRLNTQRGLKRLIRYTEQVPPHAVPDSEHDHALRCGPPEESVGRPIDPAPHGKIDMGRHQGDDPSLGPGLAGHVAQGLIQLLP